MDGNDRVDVEQVARARAPEAVDRLRVVARRRSGRWSVSSKRAQHVDLQRVDVLVLVDADVVDLGPASCWPRRGRRRGRAPVEEQVVEVDETERPLAVHVPAADRRRSARAGRRTTAPPRRSPLDSGRCVLTDREYRSSSVAFVGNRRPLVAARPCSWRTRSITSAASPVSRIEKPSGRPERRPRVAAGCGARPSGTCRRRPRALARGPCPSRRQRATALRCHHLPRRRAG